MVGKLRVLLFIWAESDSSNQRILIIIGPIDGMWRLRNWMVS